MRCIPHVITRSPRVVHRRGRETGVREEGELEAPGQLFDYVTEEEYAHLVRERQAEGFILDDGEQGCN